MTGLARSGLVALLAVALGFVVWTLWPSDDEGARAAAVRGRGDARVLVEERSAGADRRAESSSTSQATAQADATSQREAVAVAASTLRTAGPGLVVRVLDFDGRPVRGVGVRYVVRERNAGPSPLLGHARLGESALTDAAGRVELSAAEALLVSRFTPEALASSDIAEVGVTAEIGDLGFREFGGPNTPIVWLDTDQLLERAARGEAPVAGRGEVELRMPPSGRAVFRFPPVHALEGDGPAEGLRFELQLARTFTQQVYGIDGPSERTTFRKLELTPGATEAAFELVPLGMELRGLLDLDTVELGRVEGPGPRTPDETAEYALEELRAANELLVVTGRVQESGLAFTTVRALELHGRMAGRSFQPPGKVKRWEIVVGQEAGPTQAYAGFAAQFAPRTARGDFRITLLRARVEATDAFILDAEGFRSDEFAIPVPSAISAEAPVVDVGTLTLHPLASLTAPVPSVLLFSGRVTNPSGDPIEGVRVRARAQRGADARANGGPGGNWAWLQTTTTDPSGRYRIHGESAFLGGEARVEADHQHFETNRTRRVPAGSTGLDLVLEPLASLGCDVLADEGVGLGELIVFNLKAATGGLHMPTSFHASQGRGRLAAESLAPGSYVLRVTLGRGGPLLEERRLELTGPTELAELDLRGKLVACDFVLRGTDGLGAFERAAFEGLPKVVDPATLSSWDVLEPGDRTLPGDAEADTTRTPVLRAIAPAGMAGVRVRPAKKGGASGHAVELPGAWFDAPTASGPVRELAPGG